MWTIFINKGSVQMKRVKKEKLKKKKVKKEKKTLKEKITTSFTNTKSLIDTWLKIGLFLPVSTLLVTIIVFLLIRDKKIMSKRIDLNLLTNYSSLEVGYLYNDRPVYRVGETINYWGYARIMNMSKLF